MIIFDQLKQIFPNTNQEILAKYIDPLNSVFEKYEINTSLRQSHFLGQVGHESGGFKVTEENLNYSADGLMRVFPKYFSKQVAEQYARKPVLIANRVYANRMGNRSEDSGDGWRYRGRGLIQLTGKSNYLQFGQSVGLGNNGLDDVIVFLETEQGEVESAGWFWDKNQLNDLADLDDVKGITKRINGGLNGLEDRRKITELAFSVLS